MKKSLLLLLAAFLTSPLIVSAQWNPDGSGNYILTSGYAGIGSIFSTPKGGLDINNAGDYWSSFNFGTNLLIRGTTHHNTIGIFDATNSNPWGITNQSGNLQFSTMPPLGDVTTAPSYHFTLLNSGKVGIGTTTPSELLEISEAASGTAGVWSKVANTTAGGIVANDVMGGYKVYGRDNTTNTVDAAEIAVVQNQMPYGLEALDPRIDFKLYDLNGSANTTLTKMSILNSGKVGIGTTTPDEMLTVNGTIHSTEVLVDLSVPAPDYVFKKGYKLKPLAEVNRYILSNSHLPEIPSAATMERTGVNLSEMNMKLLKKVEELTLYLIEENKAKKEQQDEINSLKRQVSILSKTAHRN